VRAPLWPMFHLSALAQPGTVVAGTTREGAALASDRSVGVGKPTTVVAGTTGEFAALNSVRSVEVGSKRDCGGGHYS
jgi:hypothetical protein